ncbi:hypothetical protein [Kineosporia babensis]|uniref:Uncharacterized protein n=1 Tax=Kineosporia babensis TaxID=499548 RepID=A0A9X1NKP3_9ACTN|nr:hypothetical protein [Kineosporia babensis]MCD5315481.1 hypothetical protein [Kineosporia babensis]
MPTIDRYVRLGRRDMGKRLKTFRVFPTWKRLGSILLLNAVLSAVIWFFPWGDWATRLTGVIGVLSCTAGVYYIPIMLTAISYKQRVHEHGLVLGPRWLQPLIIPWETIDPGRVHIVDNFSAAGHHSEFNSIKRSNQAGLADSGLALNGFNTATWDPVFTYWLLGTHRPEKLAEAIEKAMVQAGYDAQGLAANAVRTRVRASRSKKGTALMPTTRGPFDPPLGVPHSPAQS